ncbi:hypothetical protein ACRAWD_21225 [Caulobacter segnis]
MRFFAARLGSRAEAEDLVQDLYIRTAAWTGWALSTIPRPCCTGSRRT